jgi:Mn2+/Fe2+ NRAMP family transporter
MGVLATAALVLAPALGWNWGAGKKPAQAARFCAAYTRSIAVSTSLMVVGLDPLKLTMFSMALTAVMLPLEVVPLLVIMNDPHYLGEHTNGWVGNSVVGSCWR